jgi:hypothetical protein
MSFLFLILSILSIGLYKSIRKNLEMLSRIDEIDSGIDVCLVTLDKIHRRIDNKTKLEIFSDEPVIRELVSDINEARDSVLKIAKIINGDDDVYEESA